MSKKTCPSMDSWLKEAKAHSAPKIGMYLTHNGIVRGKCQGKSTPGCRRYQARCGDAVFLQSGSCGCHHRRNL